MEPALRIRVTWDDDVVQDEVFLGRRVVEVGSGPGARAVIPAHAPGPEVPEADSPPPPDSAPSSGAPIRFHRRAGGWSMYVAPGAARSLAFAGEEPLSAEVLARGFHRHLDRAVGRFDVAGAVVDFEAFTVTREHPVMRALVGLVAVGAVALFAAFGYRLVRSFGDGDHRWGSPALALGAEQAYHIRARFEPSAASRLALGEGRSLEGVKSALLDAARKRPAPPRAKADAPRTTARHAAVKRRPAAPRRPAAGSGPKIAAAAPKPPPQVTPARVPRSDRLDDGRSLDDPRDLLLDRGRQAYLAAELRGAIDALTSAEKDKPLDYDGLNLLALAHYSLGENAQARARWEQAAALAPERPEAINNLGGVARREGDVEGEIGWYEKALALHPQDCHALNNLALARARQGRFDEAMARLAESAGPEACGPDYAYGDIHRAGILALRGDREGAMAALERGLARIDTLEPIKEYEVESDLLLDNAFASLRSDPRFDALTAKWLPRADAVREQILHPEAASDPGSQAPPAVTGEDDGEMDDDDGPPGQATVDVGDQIEHRIAVAR